MSEEKLVPITARIKNFQSIEDLEIEVRGFTCITGPTNIGKSAIVRALASSALNKPVGGMVRSGAKFCSVEVSSAAGWSYLWEKGDRGVNRYTVGGKVYDKTGQAQLPEVEKLGFTSVEVGTSKLHPWLASQFSPVFLLDETGASVTDFISKVSRLSVLQDAIVMSSRGKKQCTDSAKGCADRAAQVKEKLTKVAAVDSLVKLREDLVEQAKSVREYEGTISRLESAEARTVRLRAGIGALSGSASVKVPAAMDDSAVRELSAVHGYWRRLEGSAKRIIALKNVARVQQPEPPRTERDGLLAAVRYARLPALEAAVGRLAAAEGVAVPKPPFPAEQVEKLKKASSAAARIESLRRSAAALEREVEVPGAPDGLREIAAAADMERRRRRSAAEQADLEKRIAALGERIKEVETAISAIPKCGTCGRPRAASHGH